MENTVELNRLELNILRGLYDGGCTEQYQSMTITELLEISDGKLRVRMTIFKKLQKLVKAGYVKKGCLDNHADTFYLTNKAIKIIEGKEASIPIQQKKE